jgi:hypothetical protein
MEKKEDIPNDRLRKDIRGIAHEELRPNIIPVTALLDGEVAGFAVWEIPRRHWRHEGFPQVVYHKTIERMDALNDWLYPTAGVRGDRRRLIRSLRMEHANKHLGEGKAEETWYLKTWRSFQNSSEKG